MRTIYIYKYYIYVYDIRYKVYIYIYILVCIVNMCFLVIAAFNSIFFFRNKLEIFFCLLYFEITIKGGVVERNNPSYAHFCSNHLLLHSSANKLLTADTQTGIVRPYYK